MKILVDTDVLIDVALARKPYDRYAGELLDMLQGMPGTAAVAWHTIANFYYLVRSERGSSDTKSFMEDLLKFVNVSPTDTDDVVYALSLSLPDFEDALQVGAALAYRASYIVSRNTRDYKRSPLPAISPKECLEILAKE
jgi:predicted nucleic acid-binding protein